MTRKNGNSFTFFYLKQVSYEFVEIKTCFIILETRKSPFKPAKGPICSVSTVVVCPVPSFIV